MQQQSLLDNVMIVLSRTKTPGNIGAVARCMMNMGLSHLTLVRPPAGWKRDSRKLAAGAEEVIDRASVFPTLREAVEGHGLVIGTSRRSSGQRTNIRSARDMAGSIGPVLAANKVAFVFGREVNGLSRQEIGLCHELVRIPSSKAFPSLNLSHAVMVIAYELFLALHNETAAAGRELAASEEIERFYEHLQRTLEQIGFITPDNREHMLFSLRQLFGRSRPDQREVNILRGILTLMSRTAPPKDL